MLPDIPRNEDPVSDLSTNDNIILMANNLQEYPEDNGDEYNETSTLLQSEISSITAGGDDIASQGMTRELNNKKKEKPNICTLKNFIRLVLLAMFIALIVFLLAVRLVIMLGDGLAATGAFIFGRYVFSDWVRAQIEKKPSIAEFNHVINNVITEEDIVIITMNFIFVGCCVIALSLFGKRSLRKAMLKLRESKESENPPALPSVPHQEAHPLDSNAGRFTRGERITLYIIGVITFLNIVISVSLYYYFKSRENNGHE
ncbi:11492_t:CDS:2 [Racocetra fulgida]|uniref:11492_t:CDS:1 n=1 Tax=Racocetra fulgida TaxID=60492 RepID=A0A9N9D7X5_9GLOM|nr:11492_t:CDS:2 [Racocetra fulgida]